MSYSLTVPAFEAPDEVGHFSYAVHLRTTRSLPVLRVGQLSAAHQPPLYYAVAALAALPADLADHTGAFTLNPRFMWAGGVSGDGADDDRVHRAKARMQPRARRRARPTKEITLASAAVAAVDRAPVPAP